MADVLRPLGFGLIGFFVGGLVYLAMVWVSANVEHTSLGAYFDWLYRKGRAIEAKAERRHSDGSVVPSETDEPHPRG